MKHLLTLFGAILAVTAMPADIDKEGDILAMPADIGHEIDLGKDGDSFVMPPYLDTEIDPSRELGAFTTNPNFTTARIPFGQAGFAATNGGTNGGNGGAVWTVWDPWALRDALSGNDRRVVTVRGRIDLLQLFTGSPGVRLNVGSFKTIVGADRNAMIFGGGIRINNVRQVIVDNIRFHNALSLAPGEQPNGNGGIASQRPGEFSEVDNIEVSGSEHVWIHHCEFADDPWNSASLPANMRRHDGLIDIVRGANLVSVSNSIFRNHNMVTLVGNGDGAGATDRGRLMVTFYHNWYQGVTQRNPRVRFGRVHVVNNLYTDIRSYGIGVGVEASIFAERNFFSNSRRAWGWAAGVPNPPGFLFNHNNWLANSGHDSGISASGVNWRPEQFYAFGSIAASSVDAYVRRHAGPR